MADAHNAPESSIAERIGLILTTVVGSDPARHDFGFQVLDEDGDPKAGIDTDEVETLARKALTLWEPRIDVKEVALDYDGDELIEVTVDYVAKSGGPLHTATVRYG